MSNSWDINVHRHILYKNGPEKLLVQIIFAFTYIIERPLWLNDTEKQKKKKRKNTIKF